MKILHFSHIEQKEFAFISQECIPVGCVPAARRPYAGDCFLGGSLPGPGGSAWSRGGLPGPGGVCLVRGEAWSRGGT